jgi:predicted GNAT family acetyltransferase
MSEPETAALAVGHDRDGEAFTIERGGARLAEMAYTWLSDQVIRIDHTEVGEALAGQGAGKQLVHAAVAWARAEHVRIEPRCSFARSVFEKDPTLRDVLVPPT